MRRFKGKFSAYEFYSSLVHCEQRTDRFPLSADEEYPSAYLRTESGAELYCAIRFYKTLQTFYGIYGASLVTLIYYD